MNIFWNGSDLIGLAIMTFVILVVLVRLMVLWVVEKIKQLFVSEQEPLKSTDYVVEQLKFLVARYPEIKIKYYFEDFDNDHFICLDTRENEKLLYREQYIQKFDKRFILKFPNEMLTFLLLEDYLEFATNGKLIFESK
jgi:hypothetical protein